MTKCSCVAEIYTNDKIHVFRYISSDYNLDKILQYISIEFCLLTIPLESDFSKEANLLTNFKRKSVLIHIDLTRHNSKERGMQLHTCVTKNVNWNLAM